MADDIQPSISLPTPEQTAADLEAASQPIQIGSRAPAAAQPLAPPEDPNASVNVVNPEGKLVSIPYTQLNDAIRDGYQNATQDQVAQYHKEQKYGTLGQQVLTGVEGATDAATFGLSGLAENALSKMGVDSLAPEERENRREINPGDRMLGQVAGLINPITGTAGILEKAGATVAEKLGLQAAESIGAKIGSAAAKGVVENALFQGQDEVSKYLAGDPSQSLETALVDVGMSGLLGGAVMGGIGTVNPLWKATVGNKLSGALKSIADKVGGIEGVESSAIDSAAETAGIALQPEIKAALAGDPYVQKMFQTLQESASGTGVKAQEALKAFRQDVSNAAVSAVGKTPEQVEALEHLSEYDAGAKLKKTLTQRLKAEIDPISEQFDKVKEKYKGVEIPQTSLQDMGTKISEMANEGGFNLSPSSPPAKVIQRTLQEIPNLKTLEDIRRYGSVIGDTTQDPALWRVGGQLKRILRNAEENILDQHLGAQLSETGAKAVMDPFAAVEARQGIVDEGQSLLKQHQAARAAYKKAMDTIDTLNDRLHVGKYNGPGSFIKALEEMEPEAVLRRLSPKGDAGIIGELTSKFPEAASELKDFHISQALKTAGARAVPGEAINPKTLFGAIGKMSPEMKAFLFSPEQQAKLEAVEKLISSIPNKINTSGTAKALSGIWDHAPASAAGLATMMLGHGPVAGALTYGFTKIIGGVPDYTRLALLKFLGSSAPIDATGFKTMVDLIHNIARGEQKMAKGVREVFKAGVKVAGESRVEVSQRERDRLDKRLKELQKDPQAMLDIGGHADHYLPGTNQAAGMTAGNAVNYLNSLRPSTERAGPLDSKRQPSAMEKAAYNRALDIAEKPMIVLDGIKNGSITSKDVASLKTLYPGVYAKLSQKLMDHAVDTTNKGDMIPYKTRIGLSTFLGAPMDSTLRPSAVMDLQALNLGITAKREQAEAGPKQQHSSLKNLGKIGQEAQTPGQAREAKQLAKG